MYKKMCEVRYNNKVFAIFLGKNHQRIFMEIVDDKLVYPLKEDFFALNQIYNNKDKSILASKKPLTFKEIIVSLSLGALSMLVLPPLVEIADVAFQEMQFKMDVGDNYIADIEALEKHFNVDSMTIDEVMQAIDSNESLNSKHRKMMEKFAMYMNYFNPNYDLRIFGENAKHIEFVVTSLEEVKKHAGKKAAAYYSIRENKIYITADSSDETIYHEIAHSSYCIYFKRNGVSYYRSNYLGDSLMEAMNVELTKRVAPDEKSYFEEGLFLNYFRKYIDYDLEMYNKYGIDYLIEMLEKKYPKVDIIYIIDCLDTLKSSNIHGLEIIDEDYYNVVDETFKICLNNVNKEMVDVYAPLRDFLGVCRVFSDFETNFKSYLEKYNLKLEEMGYTNIITYQDVLEKIAPYEKIEEVAVDKEGNLRLITYQGESAIDFKSGKSMIFNTHFFKAFVYPKNDMLKIQALGDRNIDDDFWFSLIDEYDLAKYQDYKEIDLTFNGEVLNHCYLDDCKLFLTENKERKLGFLLENGNGEVIYQSDDKPTKAIVYIDPKNYFYADSSDSLDLSKYLCEEYLKMYVEFNYPYKLILLDDKVVFDDRPDRYRALDLDFLACMASARFASDDYYEPLKSFLIANKDEFLFSRVDIYIDRYNKALERLGVDNIISFEDIEEKISMYESIVGFDVDLGSVKPVVFEDGVYKVIESDGTKKVLEHEDWLWSSYASKLVVDTSIIYYDIIGTPEYWIKLVQDDSMIKAAYYKETQLYKNKRFIGNMYIKDTKIFLGVNEEGEYGFFLKDKDNIVYSELSNYSRIRELGNLIDFVERGTTSFDLEKIVDLLKVGRFSDISFTDQGVSIDPTYYVSINVDGEIQEAYLQDIYLTCFDDTVFSLHPFNLTFDLGRYYWGNIPLKSILECAGILNKDQLQYNFTVEEIDFLLRDYMDSLKLSRN